MYADHFRRWLAVFPSNFVLVVKSDSLYGDSKVRAAEWREVLCVCVGGGKFAVDQILSSLEII